MSGHDEHKREMQAMQAAHRRKRNEARDPGRGLVFVHTGDGKGKSSSAFGVVARALGWGQRVAVVQFIKGNWVTGERKFFERFPDQLSWHTMGDGFTWDTQDKSQDTIAARAALAHGAVRPGLLTPRSVSCRCGSSARVTDPSPPRDRRAYQRTRPCR